MTTTNSKMYARGWISTNEVLPPLGGATRVLAWTPESGDDECNEYPDAMAMLLYEIDSHGPAMVGLSVLAESPWRTLDGRRVIWPSHWMPLPEPPDDDDSGRPEHAATEAVPLTVADVSARLNSHLEYVEGLVAGLLGRSEEKGAASESGASDGQRASARFMQSPDDDSMAARGRADRFRRLEQDVSALGQESMLS